MKIYEGYFQGQRMPEQRVPRVRVLDGSRTYRLDPRLDLRNHSPTGVAWGYAGSGPAQLALALLADAVGDELALAHYQDFKRGFIERLAKDESFTLREGIVRGWLQVEKGVTL